MNGGEFGDLRDWLRRKSVARHPMISISREKRARGEPRCRGNDKIYTYSSEIALRSTPPANNLGDLFYDDKDGTSGACLGVTSRKEVRLFPEQLRLECVPVLHRLQGDLAAEG